MKLVPFLAAALAAILIALPVGASPSCKPTIFTEPSVSVVGEVVGIGGTCYEPGRTVVVSFRDGTTETAETLGNKILGEHVYLAPGSYRVSTSYLGETRMLARTTHVVK